MGGVLSYSCPTLWEDMQFVQSVAERAQPDDLQFIVEFIADDENAMVAAVGKRGRMLCYASDRIKRNRRVVTEAVFQDPHALQYADKSFQIASKRGLNASVVLK